MKIKRELDNKLIERLTLTTDQKRFNEVAGIANQENEDEYCTDLVDFALDIINKLKSSKEENIKQILKLAVNQDNMFMNIYKSLVLRKDKSVIVEKFIAIMNIQYEMVSTYKYTIFILLYYDVWLILYYYIQQNLEVKKV